MVNKRPGISLLAAILLLLAACASSRVQQAWRQIQELHDGALLVRLPGEALPNLSTSSPTADSIIEAFARYYTFSPAYFVFRSDPNAIFQLQEDSVGRRLQAASPSEEVVFLAEFGTAYDTPLLLEDESGTRPAGGVGGLPGLVVKDLRGIQLEDPFPYRVNTNYRPTNRGRAVQILNDRLWAYYSQVQRKSQRRSKLGRE